VLTVTANAASRVYGAANPTFTDAITGFVNGDTQTSSTTGAAGLTTAATTASGAGAYTITAVVGTLASTNYSFTFVNGTLTVTKAVLTVTANPATRNYGSANPAFTEAISGFVNNDTAATAVTGAASLTTTAIASSAAGTYPITAAAGTLAATNYTFTFVNGTLTVTAVPLVKLSATSLAFGSSNAGTATATQSVTLTNTGDAALSITSVNVTGANAPSYAFTNTCGTSVAAGATCNLTGDFDPVTGGSLPASISIADNAAGEPQAIALTGTGLGPAASLSVTSFSFGSEPVGSSTATEYIVLTNTGNATLNITSVTVIGANVSSFPFGNGCIATLAAGANCTLHGHFGPVTAGALTASITIVDNAGNSPQTIALSGTGLGPAVSLSATSLSFGSSAVGTATASQSVTLTNTGQEALSITSIAVTGANSTSFPLTNNCGTSVAAGASCTITGDFDPITGGALSASVKITDNAFGSPQSIALTGTGLGPAVSLSPTSVAFGSEAVGSATASQYITMTNTGNQALAISSIGITGANASSFTFGNSCGTSLAAGANCSIHGHFNPLANGSLTATITITDNAGGSPQTVALSGTGLGPTATLSATSLSFGSSPVGTATASQSVTLTNSGAEALTIIRIAVTGPNASSFAFTNSCGTSVAAGASCTISGNFDPVTGGALAGAVAITDNAVGSPQMIALTGTGQGAGVTLSATSLSFGTVAVGSTSGSQTVTLTNSGTATLTFSSIAVTGTNASSFLFANTCGTSIAAGATCTIHGHFGPTATGALTAAVTITDTAGNSPQTIALSGTGQ